MKKILIILLASVMCLAGIYVFLLDGFIRSGAKELYVESEILEAMEEEDFYWWGRSETSEFHVGDELVFWVFVGYDPEKYEIDGESLHSLRLDPFEIRSFETYSQKTLAGKEIFAAKVALQCVTCAPGMTHEVKSFRLNYLDIENGIEKKIEFNLEVDQPFLFDTSRFDVRGPQYDPVFGDAITPKFIVLGGVVVMVIGMGAIGRSMASFISGRKKAEIPLSDLDLFRQDMRRLQKELRNLENQDPEIRELLHQAYFGIAKLIYKLRGVDIMTLSASPVLNKELISAIARCKKAYQDVNLAKEEAVSILETFGSLTVAKL